MKWKSHTMNRFSSCIWLSLFCLLLAAGLAGCSSDDPTNPDTPSLPATRAELIEAYELAYTQMSGTGYEALLHEDYAYVFPSYRDGPIVWDRDEDLDSANRMFQGLPPLFAPWDTHDGVESIAVYTLLRQTEWADTPGDDPHFPGLSEALFDCEIELLPVGGNASMTVTGDLMVYAAETADGWQIAGLKDVGTVEKPNEVVSWSAMKWMYRAHDDFTGPETPDELMSDFYAAYTSMDIDAYDAVLDESFKCIFIDFLSVWDWAEDMYSTGTMFAGEPGQNPDGSYREGIQSIAIHTLIRQTPWAPIPQNDPDFPGCEQALYQVMIVFTHINGYNTMTVNSDQVFYVTAEEIPQGDGRTRPRYSLAGQRDLLGGGKANEDLTWGSIKSIYSVPE